MNNVLAELGGVWSSVKDVIIDLWLDWSEWLVGTRNAELGLITTALFIVMVCSAVLACVMAYKHPRTRLEQSLFVREIFFALLLAQLFLARFLMVENIVVRLATYLFLGLSSIAIAVYLIKEYTFDAWLRKDEEIELDMRQYALDRRQAELDARSPQQVELIERQEKLDEDRAKTLDNNETV